MITVKLPDEVKVKLLFLTLAFDTTKNVNKWPVLLFKAFSLIFNFFAWPFLTFASLEVIFPFPIIYNFGTIIAFWFIATALKELTPDENKSKN